MSLPGAALALVRALPASQAVLLARTILLLYLGLRPDCRREIRHNLRIITGKDKPWFWVGNAWRVGRNLALMARVGQRQGKAIIDRAVICGENLTRHPLERELHEVMASFHFGVWEYLPKVFSRKGFRVRLVANEQKDPGLGRQVLALRRSGGVELVTSLRQVLGTGTEPTVAGFMLDNTSQGSQVWAECDGVRMRMPEIGFSVARRKACGLVPAFARLERGRLRVDVYEPGDEESAARALLCEVRAHPEEWVWWGKAGAIQ
jgi:lauroyl/myristoyl acyltransferase